MQILCKISNLIDRINIFVGKVVSFFILIVITILVSEAILRYVFSSPSIWIEETSQILFTGYIIMGAGYTYYVDGHVNMSIFYSRLSAKGKRIMDLCMAPFFFFVMSILTWQSWTMFWEAVSTKEHTMSYWAPATYPIKGMITIGCLLLLLQGVAKVIRDLVSIILGEDSSCYEILS